MMELEKKLLLTKEEYEYLLEHFGRNSSHKENPIVKQTNYYFDTDNFAMNKQHITCRIRLKGGKYKGTMKVHTENSDNSAEITIEVRNGLGDNGFIDMGLKLQGELVTERCTIIQNEMCEVVLDKNEFLGSTDYELEIEYAPEYEAVAESTMKVFLDMLLRRKCYLDNKEYTRNSTEKQSKSERFFEKKALTKSKIETATEVKTSTPPVNCTCDNYNPDSYMDEYFYHHEFDDCGCMSCVHWSESGCDAPYGTCEYEHY